MPREIEPVVLAEGLGFTEGPTITSDGAIVVVSIDLGWVSLLNGDGTRVRWDLGGGPNGATVGDGDRIHVAQNGGNWMRNPHPERSDPQMTGGVQALGRTGARWLSTAPVAPNDLCFGPDGCLYVTDPTRDGKYAEGRIWRCDPRDGTTSLVAEVGWFCNGIGFGPDGDLYVASTGDRRVIRMSSDGSGRHEVVCQMADHAPDGFAFDIDGNLLVAALAREETPGEIQIWTPDGELLERLPAGGGRHYTNVALDGAGALLVTDAGAGTLLRLDGWERPGLALFPRRHEVATAPLLAERYRSAPT